MAYAHIAGGHLQNVRLFFMDRRLEGCTVQPGYTLAQTMYSRQLLGGGLLLAKTCM